MKSTDAERRALLVRAAEGNPFFAPGLLRAGIDHMARGGVAVAEVRDAAGELIGLAPIAPVRFGRLVPAMSVWTHLHAPLGTPLLDAERIVPAAEGLMAAMDQGTIKGRSLVFPFLPLEGPVAQALRQVAHRQGRPIVVFAAHRRATIEALSGDAPLRSRLAKKRRHELDRQRRRMAEAGTVETLSVAGDVDRLRLMLQEFFELEASGWKGVKGTALAKSARDRAFAEAAIGCGEGAAIQRMALDGRPVAMLVSFAVGDTAVTWKIAYDETLARFSPGVQIMLDGSEALMRDAVIRRVDSLAVPDHPMVDRLFPDRLSIGTMAIGPPGGSPGFRLGTALAEAEGALKPKLKAALKRLRRQ